MTLRTFATRVAKVGAIALAFAAFGVADAAAQNTGTVTGQVRNAESLAPLAGAQVFIEGTQIGNLVNNVGRFLLLNVPAGTYTINATMIGFTTASQEVTVTAGGTATVDFVLREQALALEGVIVTGTAGQARRREVGNSIEALGTRDIEVAAVTQASDILQGRAAGVQINGTEGSPGAGAEIRIRGNSSVTQSNRPLIYVDGVRIENNQVGQSDEAAATAMPLDGINPNDIDRIEIVKGPAATTLYGTEAAGGVIQIFTKRGAAGGAAWTLAVDGGASQMPHQGPSSASDVEPIISRFMKDRPDLYPSGDSGVDYLLPDGPLNENGLRLNDCATGDPLTAFANIDGYGAEPGCPESGSWFKTGYMQRYNLSVRGGSENSTYFVSGRWADEGGTINQPGADAISARDIKADVDPQGQTSYNLRANVQFQPFDGLDISLNNMYTKRSIAWIPNGNNASGLYLNVLRGERGYTPNNQDDETLFNNVNSELSQWVTSLSVGWSPTADFSHRVNFGMDYSYLDYVDFKPYGNYENPLGTRQADDESDRNMTFDYNGSWRTDFTSNVSSAFSWGGQVYEQYSWGLSGTDADFAGPGAQLVGGGTLQDSDEDRQTIRSGGFFLQEQVGLNDRLFITGGVRWDGFSTFGSGFGLAAYPKISAAYTISDEDFFPETGFIDALKLRGAYGKSGRAPGAFDAVKVYAATQADESVPGLVIDNLGNADLGPEISAETELGFEASLFNGRLSADFTYYTQSTTDALVSVTEAPSFGTNNGVLRNIGETENKGTETILNIVAMRTDNIEWSFNTSYSTNRSKVLSLGPLESAGFEIRTGYAIGVEYDNAVMNPTEVGVLPDLEPQVLGVAFPQRLFAVGTRFTWNQSLTFDVLAEGQTGHFRTAGIGWATSRRETWPACYGIQNEFNANGITNLTAAQLATCHSQYSSWGSWTDQADFIKLRSASISYRLPEGLIPATRSASVSLQAKNLFTWTHYQGLDPEATDRGNTGGFGAGSEYFSEYYNAAPPRVYILNFTVNF
jgi:TonB-linked SusC/RagA family outer membrane protein